MAEPNRILGKNVKRLMIYKATRDMNPNGGGFGASMTAFQEALTTPGRMAELYRNALAWVDEAIAVMRTAPDNPYGDDEETIAGAIVAALEAKRGSID